MNCAMCPDEADRFVTTRQGRACFCHFCVELWWGLMAQPSVLAFYEGTTP